MKNNPELSPKQNRFVRICEQNKLKVYYTYSGKFMFGRICPAVNVDNLSELNFNANKYSVDAMGLGYVVYCE